MSTPQPVQPAARPEFPAKDHFPDPATSSAPRSESDWQPASLAANPHSDSDPSTQYPLPQGVVPLHQEHPYLRPPTRMNSLGRLGHYEILAVLGSGGFGKVFQALDEKLQRLVAIKVLHNRYDDGSHAVERFMREARAAAAIHHENVVIIHAIEEYPVPFLVMEYIQGQTLNQRITQRGRLPIGEALTLGLQIARGMLAAHELGIIHRDIKPANVLLTHEPEPRAKLTDFGLAWQNTDPRLTGSGIVVGTPLYIAPEQAQEQVIDTRADQFSFGAMLYHLLAGKPPFDGANTLAILVRVTTGQMHPLTRLRPEIPVDVIRLIERLLEKNPEKRFPNTAMLVSELERLCELWKSGRLEAPRLRHDRSTTAGMSLDVPVPPPIVPTPLVSAPPWAIPQPKEYEQLPTTANLRKRPDLRSVVWSLGIVLIVAAALFGGSRISGEFPFAGRNAVESSAPKISSHVPPTSESRVSEGVMFIPPPPPQVNQANLPQKQSLLIRPKELESPAPQRGTAEYAEFARIGREYYQQFRADFGFPTPERLIARFQDEMLSVNPTLFKMVDVKSDEAGIHVNFPDGVTNYSPIYLLPNLHEVVVNGGEFDFESFRNLDFRRFNGSDLRFVYSLAAFGSTKAHHLDLTNVDLASLEWLRDLPNVTALTFKPTPLLSYTPIYDRKLDVLAIRNEGIDLRSVQGAQFRRFDLLHQAYSDEELAPIRSMDVEDLSVCFNPIVRTLNWVPKHPKLRQLALNTTPIRDLSPLIGSNIETLWILETRVDDLTPLKFLPKLKELHCRKIPARDFTPLIETNIEMIEADLDPIRDEAWLRKMPRLRMINYRLVDEFFAQARNP
ncbi:serine/threonine protein kinase [Tuwongella immobilis]|uniref:Protein kinase domain-containing protein n=1 Tax=Tuwongella immobilis TaxID=692036 RepID=A0A6C2YK39_9BACT|nr:serine/threonine-protein kinase [Tuwongella immobilis]VIP01734.1 serine threonine protein partial : Serine/threonine protein kinase OS=Planctomyces maris DSM 8797 GN=PM8797T_04085 PE=3 SV=1: Pkinase [Tuwongella immobilis]VTR99290.1 serine threonine protein partial : Serine/threonine protein kinase OS=Planctomyces maris DSM 8797 GN=PM8797T_04085 PE=3 SV=1: Pkinase [Tuwongella immobilis]